MGATKKTKGGEIRIHEDVDGDRSVMMYPSTEGHEAFSRTGKQVIVSCQLGIGIDLWFQELDAMLQHVGEWAGERRTVVRSCYCAAKIQKIVLYFLPVSASFDFDLADQIVDLNVQLMQRFNVGMVESHQIPWDEADRFLTAGSARFVYGERLAAPRPVEP